MTESKTKWVDAWEDIDGALAQVEDLCPCTCCGERCISQLEGLYKGAQPWEMCSACDPALDEHGSDWLCACRRARGDANWELPDSFERKLGLLDPPKPGQSPSAAHARLVEEGRL